MTHKFVKTGSKYDAKEKVWSGPIKDHGKECSIGELALEALLKDPKHISQICHHNGKKYTNKDIATLSIRCAQNFKELGLQQCDVFGICGTNSDYVAPLFFGGMLSGLIASTLDTSFDKDSIKHVISISKPKIMFCDGSIYETMRAATDECNMEIPIYTMKDHLNGVKNISQFLMETGMERNFLKEPLLYGASQISAILCSSGTTGLPKGVCVSHEGLLKTPVFALDKDDIFLTFSTVFWLSGLGVLIEATVQGATRVIVDKPFCSEDFFNIIEQHKVTVMNGPPSHIATVLASKEVVKRDLSSLCAYLCGGSSIPFAFVEKMRSFYPNITLFTGYGMSEAASIICMGEPESSGSNGRLTPNFQVKIINENGENVDPGVKGEFCIKPPCKWAGYYGNPTATNDIYDENGWIKSGDLGYIDDTGVFYIIGRKKDIMKYNNFHFSPTHIEDIISHLSGIAEVCVCGIPDPIASHLPAAAVVKIPESKVTADDITNFVNQKLPHFSHLHGGVYFVESLPKTASGKYLRSEVQVICENLKNSL